MNEVVLYRGKIISAERHQHLLAEMREYRAKWSAKNPEKYKASQRAYDIRWRRENPEEKKSENREQYLRMKRVDPTFLPRAVSRRSRNRARELMAFPSWADENKINEFYLEAARRTLASGVPHEVDHIIPLKSRKVCGLHTEFNLQVLSRIDNMKKGNRFAA